MTTQTVLTVPKLLSALVLLATLSGGFFAWDFERAIGRLDEVARQTGEVHETATVLTTRVDGLDTRVTGLASQVVDHEKRLGAVEGRK